MTLSPYIPLGFAIALEVLGTTLLQRSEQFTRLAPTVGMAVCYLASFYLLSVSLKVLPRAWPMRSGARSAWPWSR